MKNNKLKFFIGIMIVVFVASPVFVTANEAEIEKLEEKIGDQRDKIADLDKQIAEQRALVAESAAQANTIQGKINEIQATKRKLETGIAQTQAEIQKSQLTLEKLSLEITDKKSRIELNTDALAETLRTIDKLENMSLIETVLQYENMSEIWEQIDALRTFQNQVKDTVHVLQDLEKDLQGKQQDELSEKKELESSKKILDGERSVVAQTKAEQDKLYALAKSKEQTYQSILQQKIAQREAFEAAMLEFESQLQTLVDPESFPDAATGILSWPVDTVRITQSFGGTQFAKANPHVYGRAMHNGTDFGVPVGENVRSVLSGTVRATGNTDAYPGCVSWGKWILVDHPNGLSSLYAHLSSILVSPGQSVSQREVIGLSGNTGYSTGPHLHLTLYATQGVSVAQFSSFKAGSTGCSATGATTPVAPLDAYLDPMQYLPG